MSFSFGNRDLPRRHHYAISSRIPDILVDMKVSWRGFQTKISFFKGTKTYLKIGIDYY